VILFAAEPPPGPEPARVARAPSNPRSTGTPFIRAWNAEDYNAAPVNYDVVQHPGNGLLYAANNYGVLEFDGATWRLLAMPNGGVARTLAVDARGRVWSGGSDEIAVLAPDARGRLQARSMLERLPEAQRSFGALLFAAAAPNGVYFAATNRLVFFPLEGPARAWAPPKPMASLTWIGDALHLTTTEGAWLVLQGDTFAAVLPPAAREGTASAPPGPFLAARPASGGGWRLLTPRGPVHWAGGSAPPVALGAEASTFFQDEPAQSAVFLADGRMAFGRVLGGVTVFDPAGRFVQRIDRTHGLPSNRVEQLCEDAEGGLWLAQRAGLARVQLDSPFAKHGLAQGVEGRPRALHRHDGRLYIAHNEGASWRDDATGEFHAVGGLAIGLTRFLSIGSRLLGTSNAIYDVTPQWALPIVRRGITPLVPLTGTQPDRPWLLGGGAAQAWLFTPEGASWKTAGALTHLPADVASLVPTPDGFVWGASSDGRIWRIDFRTGPRLDAPVALYGPEQGVPRVRPRDAELFLLGADVLATSSAWILRYDRTADRFRPETRIAGVAADATVTRAHMDSRGTLWLQLDAPDGRLVRIQPVGAERWSAEPLPMPAVAGLVANRIFHDEIADTLWVASQGALVSIDLTWRASRPRPARPVHIRRIETAARELVFGGASDRPLDAQVSTLSPERNALRFTFASPRFEGDFLGRAQTQYRTRLEGLEPAWTPWSEDTVRELSNLPFRRLTFRVEARGPDGRAGTAAAWTFAIAPPWWLARWAFGGYAVLGLLSLAGIVRWRTRALRDRAAALETVVATRTDELRRTGDQLRENNAELARLHAIERDEKLDARLAEEKARLEVLRYQLNPHFLYNTLASICGTARTNPEATRSMAQRLADFCRLTLTRADETETVREEVRMLQSYLDIEKTRWRDSLQIEINVVPDALEQRLPSFLLLPLIENAIKHGGRTTRGTLRIRLTISAGAPDGRTAGEPAASGVSPVAPAAANRAALEIEVANTGLWDTVTPNPDSTGIGLENMRRRLRRYYPDTHELAIEAKEGWVSVKLKISNCRFPIEEPDSSAGVE